MTTHMDKLIADGEKAIAHYGVRGMRWGVTTKSGSSRSSAAASVGKKVGGATKANLVEVGRGSVVAVLSVAGALAASAVLADGGSSADTSALGGVAAGVATRTALTVGTSRTPGKVAGRIAKKTGLNLAKAATIAGVGYAAIKSMDGSDALITPTEDIYRTM